ncbi:CaiB/BaiF CoA-transferase family protein [Pseudonocardia sp. N23]|uniref:CaiB/BaiF CoA transferase family protein n=1 Tax=Pseudonocardia sp. N23 TaxID=1987376 RepID=UPI000BFDC57D|nr:CoA transferase [Pseudonocardia sp. N23]GAY08840.1 CAIB/BAIF family protein [Pseudonocardia sp. N23]
MRPLEDVRIVSLEQYGAGPFGSMHLAELGADIVKIEDPSVGGDVGRHVPPYAEDGGSLFFESFNRDKSSITLDIRTPEGREVFHDLVRGADAVYSNLRGDVPAKLGIRYADLVEVNPRIVCCSLTGFGMTGPRSREPGYDYVLQALGGWMSLTGEPGGPPQKTGLSLVDYSGGYVAAISLLAGIHAARRDGVGTDCDVSLYDTAVSLLTYPATWHMTAGFEPVRTRHSAHPSLIPFQAFEASDGWLVVGCAKEKFWQRLTVVIGRPELAGDPRFATFADRARHRDVIIPLLEEIFAGRTAAEWLVDLYAASIPCAPINEVDDALTDPHTLERDLIAETEHPRYGTVRTLRSAVRVGPPGDDRAPTRAAPAMGEHTGSVLRGLGYDDDRIAALRRSGALGSRTDVGKD